MSAPNELVATLAHHDAAIGNLSGRMSGVEKTLVDHGTVLHRIENAVTKADAQPRFDFHKTVRTVTSLATLFALVVGGILWLVFTQIDGVKEKVSKYESLIEKMSERIRWNQVDVEVKRK